MMGTPDGRARTPEEQEVYDAVCNSLTQASARGARLADELASARESLRDVMREKDEQWAMMSRNQSALAHQLEADQQELRTALFCLASLSRRHTLMVQGVRRASSRIAHGEMREARAMLDSALSRDRESDPPEELGACECSGTSLAGRSVRAGVVRLNPQRDGLVVRIDDDANPEFWLEVRISEVALLRALAQVHRLAHSPAGGAAAGGE